MNKGIILVNMDESTAKGISIHLGDWGYIAVRINSTENLIPLLRAGEQSLIIFQFNEFAPEEFARFDAIRHAITSIPILATSPAVYSKQSLKSARASVVDFLEQPMIPSELKKMLED